MVSLEDRTVIVGATGTGKTTFGKLYLEAMRRSYPAACIYILDSKQDGRDFSGKDWNSHIVRSQEAPDPLLTPGGIQVWQPPLDRREEYNKWLTQILKARRPAIVFIDELSSLSEGSMRYPDGYALLQRQGRSLHISVITLTQEAAYIPRQVFGQTTHIFRFGLLNASDGKRVDTMMNRPEKERGTNPPTTHGFFYWNTKRPGRIFLYRDYHQFFGE